MQGQYQGHVRRIGYCNWSRGVFVFSNFKPYVFYCFPFRALLCSRLNFTAPVRHLAGQLSWACLAGGGVMLLLFAAGLVRSAVGMGYAKVHLQEIYNHE